MSDITAKVEYVKAEAKAQKKPGNHHCHWPGCDKLVPPAMWGCRTHWYRLPKAIRDAIWKTYRCGQEIDKRPSPAYLEAAKAARDWIAANT